MNQRLLEHFRSEIRKYAQLRIFKYIIIYINSDIFQFDFNVMSQDFISVSYLVFNRVHRLLQCPQLAVCGVLDQLLPPEHVNRSFISYMIVPRRSIHHKDFSCFLWVLCSQLGQVLHLHLLGNRLREQLRG